MWAEILRKFTDSPSQTLVVRYLLENGLGINEEGRIACNCIEIPATHLANAIGTDRRVVDATARRILSMPELRDVFLNMRVTPDLSQVGEALGLAVITVIPEDAEQKGIVGAVVEVLTDYDLSIRQIFVTDPHLSEEPKMVVIVSGAVPSVVFQKLKGLPQIKKIII